MLKALVAIYGLYYKLYLHFALCCFSETTSSQKTVTYSQDETWYHSCLYTIKNHIKTKIASSSGFYLGYESIDKNTHTIPGCDTRFWFVQATPVLPWWICYLLKWTTKQINKQTNKPRHYDISKIPENVYSDTQKLIFRVQESKQASS